MKNNLPVVRMLGNISIAELNISARLYNALYRAGIKTVNQIHNLLEGTFVPIKGINTVAHNTIIKKHLQALLNSVDSEGGIHWDLYCKALNIPLIPRDLSVPSEKYQYHILKMVPDVVRTIVNDERRWYILQRRHGLNNTSTLTLQDLGEAFGGISRQRVDQIYKGTLIKLREVFIERKFAGKRFRVHPTFLSVVNELIFLLSEYAQHGVTEISLLSYIADQFGITIEEVEEIKPTLFLLLVLAGAERVDFPNDEIEPVWGYFDNERRRLLELTLVKIHNLLTIETAQPLQEIDILVRLNRGLPKTKKITLYQLQWLISLCSTIERREDGLIWGRFEYLKGRPNQAERVLLEEDKPLHIDEITRRINHLLVPLGYRKLSSRNLTNQLAGNERFVSIGRSGFWGLSSWRIESRTILELMEESLISLNRPATVDEIYDYVVALRPLESVTKRSVTFYLASERKLFTRIGRDKWGLSRWAEAKTSESWGLLQVAEFVVDIFRKNRTDKLPYAFIKESLMEAAGVKPRVAQGMLSVNPVIITKKEDGRLFAILQPDYKQKLHTKEISCLRKKATLGEQIAQRVKEILSSSQNQQILLSELVDKLREEFEFPQRTAPYQYIAKLDFVERISIPGTSRKICRLKGYRTDVRFPQISTVRDSVLREKIRRAVKFLDVENVDIGLFLLSKEFEAVLKRFLSAANKRGGLDVPPKLPEEKWKLDSMISYVKQNKIITDEAVLSFLRQKRNDRAHGTMPSLEERMILMNSVSFVAGLYIDYIRFFDDLYHQL